jgi:PAS domain S-box-containing protein
MATKSRSPKLIKDNSFVNDLNVFKLMVDAAPDPIIVIQDRKVIYGNQKASEMTGYSFKEFIGTNFLNFVAQSDRLGVIKKYISRMAGFKSEPIYEVNVLRKNGSTISSEVNAIQLKYEKGTIDFVIFRDITERKRQEQQLRAEKEEVERLNKALIGRELKMIELKKQVDTLQSRLTAN